MVHGQGGDASRWSNDGNGNFKHDDESLIEKLREDAGDAIVYWARMSKDEGNDGKDDTFPVYNYKPNRFFLTKLDDGEYDTDNSRPELQDFVTELDEEVTKHTIIVFESAKPYGYHREAVRELHTVVDRISYDYLIVTGKIPTVNFISHSRGGIASMLYVTGYRQNGKIDQVEYSEGEIAGYINRGDGIYEKPKSYATNGALLNSHYYNVHSLYSMGTPYKGTKLNQGWATELVPGSMSQFSAKDITDETIQGEIKNNWEAACSANRGLKLYANAGEISLNFLVGLLGDASKDISGALGEKIAMIDGVCNAIANEYIPPFQSVLTAIQVSSGAVAGASVFLPFPFNGISIAVNGTLLAASSVLQAVATDIKNQAQAVSAESDAGSKILLIDSLLYSYYDFLNSFMDQILGLTSGSTGISSVADFGDLFISTDSQLAEGFSNVIPYSKMFAYEGIEISKTNNNVNFSYSYRNFDIEKKTMQGVAIPHNLEPYDSELQNRIRDTIELEKQDYFKNLDISLESGSTTGNWQVKIVNNNSQTGTIVYNERMCFEDDAKNFQHLTNLRSFKLSPGGERTVTISGNGNAGFIAISVSYFLPSGKSINAVTYTDGLNANNLSMNPPKQNIVSNGAEGNATLVPNYLNLKVLRKSGSVWSIRLENSNDEAISVTYNSRMCFDDAARNFYGLRDLVDITIPKNGYRDVQITENGTANFITAAINYVVDGTRYRRISSANGLTSSGGINAIRKHEVIVASGFPEVSSVLKYVTMVPTSRSGFIWYTWGIRISNSNSVAAEVSYNAKLCFEGDAKAFENLSDIITISIPANSSKIVTINHNGTAGWIAASINFSYLGYEYRRVTYCNGLAINPYKVGETKNNEIKTSL